MGGGLGEGKVGGTETHEETILVGSVRGREGMTSTAEDGWTRDAWCLEDQVRVFPESPTFPTGLYQAFNIFLCCILEAQY